MSVYNYYNKTTLLFLLLLLQWSAVHILSPHCRSLSYSHPFYMLGVLSPPGRGLQFWEQCTDWLAGDRCGHSNCDCDQSGAFEEEAIRHHQSWHRRGKPPVIWSRVWRFGQRVESAHTSALISAIHLIPSVRFRLNYQVLCKWSTGKCKRIRLLHLQHLNTTHTECCAYWSIAVNAFCPC